MMRIVLWFLQCLEIACSFILLLGSPHDEVVEIGLLKNDTLSMFQKGHWHNFTLAKFDLRQTVRKISDKIKSQNCMQQLGTVSWASIEELTWTEAGAVNADEIEKRSGLGGFIELKCYMA